MQEEADGWEMLLAAALPCGLNSMRCAVATQMRTACWIMVINHHLLQQCQA
jgi:hypothetical protein